MCKQCSKCEEVKELSEFYKDKDKQDGLTTQCKSCKKIYLKEYRAINRDAVLYKLREYYQNNKDMFREYGKSYKKANKEAIQARELLAKDDRATKRKLYRQTEKYKARHKNEKHKRRSKERRGDVTTEQIIELQKNSKVCYWCNTSLKNIEIHIDHYIPLAKGGKHTISNLVMSCSKCNQSKSAKDPIEFANSLGRLL